MASLSTYFRSEVIAKNALSDELESIFGEWFNTGSSQFTALSAIDCLISLPDMMSLAPSGRLQIGYEYWLYERKPWLWPVRGRH